MKGKNIFRIIGILLIIFFTTLYIAQGVGYYEYTNSKKTTLTEESIKRYEEDLKNGVEIDANNYLEKEKNYNNNLTKVSRGLSTLVEKGFNGIMNKLFNEIDKAVKSK